MSVQKTPFYLILPSNTKATDPEDENFVSEYKVRIKPRVLAGEWEAALVELIYPNKIKNVRNPIRIKIGFYQFPVEIGGSRKYIDLLYPVSHEYINIFSFQSVPLFLTFVNVVMRAQVEKIINRLKNEVRPHDEEEEESNIHMDPEVAAKSDFLAPRFEFDEAFGTCRLLFGYDKNKVTGYDMFPLIYPDFGNNPDVAALTGITQENISTAARAAKAAVTGEIQPDIRGTTKFIYVYTDIIEPVSVGNAEVPLLRAVSINETDRGRQVTERFERPYYQKVIRSTLDQVMISLVSEIGQRIQFQGHPVVCVLHVRPIKSSSYAISM